MRREKSRFRDVFKQLSELETLCKFSLERFSIKFLFEQV